MPKSTTMQGKAGLYRRALNPLTARNKIINRISKVSEDKRSQDQWWELGENIMLNGLLKQDESQIQEGMKHLKRASDMDPPSIAALMDLGWLLIHRNMEFLALEYLEKAANLSTMSRDLFAMLAICHARLGNRDLALNAIKIATLSAEATSLDFDLKRSLEDTDNKDFIDFAKSIRFLKINPKDAHEAGFPVEEIYEIIRLVAELTPHGLEDISTIEKMAEIDYIANDYESARKKINRIVRSEEATAQSYLLLGLMAYKENDEESAERYYETALKLDNDCYLANVNFTSIKGNKGEYTAKVLEIMEWSVKNPDENDSRTSAVALSNLGNYFALQGDFERDIALQEASLRLYSDDTLSSPINLFTSYLSVGNISKASQMIGRHRKNFKTIGHYELAKALLKNFKASTKDPMLNLNIGIEILNSEIPLFNHHSIPLLVERALKDEKKVPPEYRHDFYYQLGYLANAAGCRKVSSKCWKQLASISGDQSFYMNYAMDLATLGENEQAIKVLSELSDNIKTINERACSMSAVILDLADKPQEAREMLEKGFRINPKFSLLYSNYIGLALSGKIPDEQDEMLMHIVELIPSNTQDINLRFYLSQAKAALGKITSAAQLIISCFFERGKALPLENLLSRDSHKDEIDVNNSFDISSYKYACRILYRAGYIEECQKLLETMHSDPVLNDGDCMVALQTIARRSPHLITDIAVLEGMGEQIPVLIERAIYALEAQDFNDAQDRLHEIEAVEKEGVAIRHFNHLEGNPASLVECIKARCLYSMGHSKEALSHLQTAIDVDDQTPYIYDTFIDICGGDDPSLVYKIVGLAERRLEGSPWLRLRELSVAIETEDYAKAIETIRNHKEQLTKLLPSGRYQAYLETTVIAPSAPSIVASDWIISQTEPHFSWLSKAHQLLGSGHDEAAVIYLLKWFEDIVNDWFIEFRNSYGKQCRFHQGSPFSVFIQDVKDKMTLGAMVNSLSIGIRSHQTYAPEKLLVNFLKNQNMHLHKFLNREGVIQLKKITSVRNCLMHTTPVNNTDITQVRRWLMDDDDRIGKIGKIFIR